MFNRIVKYLKRLFLTKKKKSGVSSSTELNEEIVNSMYSQFGYNRRFSIETIKQNYYFEEVLHRCSCNMYTDEGYLFWDILHKSVRYSNRFDYATIAKILLEFGPDAFEIKNDMLGDGKIYKNKYFDHKKYTLNNKGIRVLFKSIRKSIKETQ